MNDFFETGIYIVIVAVATLLVLIVVLLMSTAAKPQKQRRQVRSLPAGRQKLVAPELKLLTEGGPVDGVQGKKLKKEKKPRQEKPKKNPKQGKQEKRDQERADREQNAPIADKKVATAAAIGEEVEVPVVESVKVAELPSANTLDDSDDGEQEDTSSKEDLMSIFQVEEAEDSYVSDLANKLFDVDTSNIQDLSMEVLAVFSSNRPAEETKEE